LIVDFFVYHFPICCRVFSSTTSQDGDGSISFRELVSSLRELNLCLDDTEVQLLMDLMEVTGTNSAVNSDAFSDYVDAGVRCAGLLVFAVECTLFSLQDLRSSVPSANLCCVVLCCVVFPMAMARL